MGPGCIYYGGAPYGNTLQELKELGIQVIWNLTEELIDLLEEEKNLFPFVINSPIHDYSIPSSMEYFKKDVEKVANYLEEGKNIFIHCMAGHGRTGMGIAAVTMKVKGVSAEVGLRISKKACRGPEMESQVEFIKDLTF